eukprot:12791150-Ditylum_brightwellii.AAC.1
MPGYISKALIKLQRIPPKQPQQSPHKHIPIQYSQKVQLAQDDNSVPLTPKQIKHVQKAVRLILYYARTVDSTLSATLSAIATEQSKGTEETEKATKQ